LKEQSSTAQGTAFAGAAAGGEDISYMFFNPAAIALHPGANCGDQERSGHDGDDRADHRLRAIRRYWGGCSGARDL
jgi:hypothetical protein